jgi:magnesium transporter
MSQNDNNQQDSKQVHHLAASVIRRAPMDATNVLLNEPDAIVSAVFREIEPRLVHKILRHFPEDRAELIKDKLPEHLGEQLERNMSYPEDTIGRLMEPTVGILDMDATVQTAISTVRDLDSQQVVFTYAYVVDEEQRLQGVVVMRDLLLAEPNAPITDIMINNPFWFTPETSIKQAMLEVVHRHYPVYPVCDEQGKFLGRVQGYELFEEHAIEVSAQPGLMVGVDDEEHLGTPVPKCFRNRHPWLQLNLLTAFIAAFVVGMFEDTIAQIVVLAAFLPVLAGQSGNTGCQALAVTLRGMTLGEFKQGFENNLITKELKLGALNGALVGVTAALGMLAFATVTNTPSGYVLALVVFLAMLGSCIASGIAGVLIPVILKRLGADPATASTIFLTTATDVLSMGLLLGLATILVL